MERTESIVIQVAPSFENQKIAEMEIFGWNLQGRQEIHEAGDAYGAPSFFDSNTYVIKQRVSQYVKLHFIRSLALTNLDEVKRIESEYFNLPFPEPPSKKWPIGCISASALFILCMACSGIVNYIGFSSQGSSSSAAILMAIFAIVGGGLIGLAGLVPGIFWYRSNKNKAETATKICQQSARRARELISQVKSLALT